MNTLYLGKQDSQAIDFPNSKIIQPFIKQNFAAGSYIKKKKMKNQQAIKKSIKKDFRDAPLTPLSPFGAETEEQKS